jgi:hypothetical protein
MTRKRITVETIGEIQPDVLYRTTLSPFIFGYGPQMTHDKIIAGELPKPIPLSETSRFSAWTGQQILDHRKKMRELAEKRVAEKPASTRKIAKPVRADLKKRRRAHEVA